jgi:hypothetical protein
MWFTGGLPQNKGKGLSLLKEIGIVGNILIACCSAAAPLLFLHKYYYNDIK